MHTCWIPIDPKQKNCNDHVRVSSFFSLSFLIDLWRPIPPGHVWVLTKFQTPSCYLFNVSYCFFSTDEHVPPYICHSRLRKKLWSKSKQDYDRTWGDNNGAGRQAGMNVYDRDLERSWSIYFSLFSKKILYNRSPRGFMLNSYTFWRFCDWRWDTMNRLPLVRQKSGSSIQIFHRLCRFSATLFSQMEMWCLCLNYVFSCHSMAHSWFCAGKVSHERKDDHLRLGWRLKNL